MRLCKDCRWFNEDFRGESLPKCSHPELVQKDYVMGAPGIPRQCHAARTWDHLCGPEGRYFEEKRDDAATYSI